MYVLLKHPGTFSSSDFSFSGSRLVMHCLILRPLLWRYWSADESCLCDLPRSCTHG